jgi:hypothetical protein
VDSALAQAAKSDASPIDRASANALGEARCVAKREQFRAQTRILRVTGGSLEKLAPSLPRQAKHVRNRLILLIQPVPSLPKITIRRHHHLFSLTGYLGLSGLFFKYPIDLLMLRTRWSAGIPAGVLTPQALLADHFAGRDAGAPPQRLAA